MSNLDATVIGNELYNVSKTLRLTSAMTNEESPYSMRKIYTVGKSIERELSHGGNTSNQRNHCPVESRETSLWTELLLSTNSTPTTVQTIRNALGAIATHRRIPVDHIREPSFSSISDGHDWFLTIFGRRRIVYQDYDWG